MFGIPRVNNECPYEEKAKWLLKKTKNKTLIHWHSVCVGVLGTFQSAEAKHEKKTEEL